MLLSTVARFRFRRAWFVDNQSYQVDNLFHTVDNNIAEGPGELVLTLNDIWTGVRPMATTMMYPKDVD